MLKTVLINKKKVPVPVPVKTLDQALQWIDETLVPEGHTITRIVLDGRVLTDSFDLTENLGAAPMDVQTALEVHIESPVDLAVQTVEAIHNLASVAYSSLKHLAVECWQAKPVDKPEAIGAVETDIEMILELVDHCACLVDPSTIETAALNGLSALLQRDLVAMQMAVSNSDWRATARILLNRLEPILNDLIAESESLQIKIMALHNNSELAKAGS